MSFLDRLKREADQQRLQAEQLAAEREARETRYKNQIEPKLKALTSYLEGLAATLLEVKPPIVVRMAIQGYGELCAVPYWDYKIEHERRHRSYTIAMTWSMKVDGERAPVVRAEGVTRVKTLINAFRQYHLGGIKEEKRTPQGELSCATFHARGFIKARMEATISADDPVLRLLFDNVSWLGASRRQVPWEQIDDNLFDRIARFLVREDDSLFTEELPDALRQKLRQEPESAGSQPQPAAPLRQDVVQQPALPPAPALVAAPMAAAAPDVKPAPAYAPEVAPPYLPMMQGETIEIDESKLGLADFSEDDEPLNALSAGALSRAPSAPRQAPMPSSAANTIGTIPAPPPVTAGEVIPIDESKLGIFDEPKPIVIERTPAPAPRVAAPAVTAPAARPSAPLSPPAPIAPAPAAVATAAAAASPSVSAATTPRPAAPAPTSAPSVRTAPTPPAATIPSAAISASTAATLPAAPAAVAVPAPVAPAIQTGSAGESEPVDEVKERDAALFRLRMRAMLARLRTDEPEAGQG